MHKQSQDPTLARYVRGLYNYQVGQKAAVGRLLLWVFGVSALVFWGAIALDMVSALAHGLARAFLGH